MSEKQKVIIVGAGISGLAAVYYMKKKNPEAQVTLLEASDRIGGKIKTVRRDGFIIECGPEGYMARKPTLTNLIKDIGLGDKLVRSGSGTYYIYVNHRLRKMPNGSVMGIPTKLLPMVTTGLISPLGKLRAALDLLIPRVYQDKDISLNEFFERRLGAELVTNMIEPLLSGIYNGNLSDMSLEATLPQFAAIEKKHRSLILGMKSIQPPKQAGASKKAVGRFLSLSCGLDVLVEKLASYADEIKLNTPVRRIESGKVTLEDFTELKADAIILATSPKQLGPLLDFPEAWNLSNDKRTTTATVALAFKKGEVESLDGTGYVVSRKEGLNITACSFMDHKWSYTAPEDCTLIRTYVGTADNAAIVGQSDEEIEKKALADLRKIGKIGTPLFSVITRQIDNMPQYTINHNQRVQVFEEVLAKISGIYACGAILHGVGLPDCVDNAMHVSEDASNKLKKNEEAVTNS
ncbi:protoporphyrinogen oxidase [Sporolactobacillus laevolacticus]|uniref:Coproporphyrinogen III oxidase n=1 Tax=Sporolactobacillus laevolacticus DSM 442 TaxID=1395513 RepID=V6IXG1_9BACL|nr:protoporphyrinogen oxidase [Sporolactobacillus laevolacticus]EST11336.1 protoporphyrinogen oxidase [Sporolactobacillus laevolacticus DSM 442]